MRIWLSILAVTVAAWVMKAAGPLVAGDRRLPYSATRVIDLMAPVLLSGLIIVEVGGEGWHAVDPHQVAGVAVAGAARVLKAPMLLAVVLGIATTALLRSI